MPFGLVLSILFHASLLGWALFSMHHSAPPLSPDTPAISADIITPSDFLRLKQGSEDAKQLDTKANDKPKPDDSKNDTPKPANAPPPPPPPAEEQVAKAEPPPEPAPPEVAEPPPPPPPEATKPPPDPIAKKIEEPPPAPPPPEPAPGPTPDEKKLLEQKLEDERQAEEAKKKADEDAKKKADDDAKKKAEDEAKKKALADAKKKAADEAKRKKAAELKKKKQEEAKKKAEAAKKQFDPSKIASLLDKSPDDAPPKALLDKDKRKKGQQASGSKSDAFDTGKEAGTATGSDTVLSAREQDLLKGMLKSQLNGCWRPPGTGGGDEVPVVVLHWELNPDGSLVGEPRVESSPNTAAGQVYAEAALRAVRTCAPFHLPADKYEGGWKYIDWTFDPRQML